MKEGDGVQEENSLRGGERARPPRTSGRINVPTWAMHCGL